MIYYIVIAMVLLSGCAQEVIEYKPTSWPRTLVMESALETDVEIERVERVRRAVAMLNKRIGAAVYQVAVTNDASAAGCNTLEVAYVDQVMNNDGTPRLGVRATYISDFWPCKAYLQLQLKDEPENNPHVTQPDESVITHELMHDLLGGEHDDILTKPNSVFSISSGCLAEDLDPSINYRPLPYCTNRLIEEITDELVARVRAVMKLPPA